MIINRETDLAIVKKQIGKRATFRTLSGEIRGIFIGFWNPEFTGNNSQTTPCKYSKVSTFNLLLERGGRIAVDSFLVVK